MHSLRVPCLRCSFAGVTVTASFGALRHPPVTVKTIVSRSRVLAQSRHRHDGALRRPAARAPACLNADDCCPQIESDFYATDAGRQHFSDQLTSIRYCVQEYAAALPTRLAHMPCAHRLTFGVLA